MLQLASGQADSETLYIANVLACRPPEFQPGECGRESPVQDKAQQSARPSNPLTCLLALVPWCLLQLDTPQSPVFVTPCVLAGQLIAAGSYGRVYAGEWFGCIGGVGPVPLQGCAASSAQRERSSNTRSMSSGLDCSLQQTATRSHLPRPHAPAAGTYGDQPAALKLLLLDEETAHAILNEVRLCLKLNHKNLVQLLDCAVVATNKQAAAAGFTVRG